MTLFKGTREENTLAATNEPPYLEVVISALRPILGAILCALGGMVSGMPLLFRLGRGGGAVRVVRRVGRRNDKALWHPWHHRALLTLKLGSLTLIAALSNRHAKGRRAALSATLLVTHLGGNEVPIDVL